MTGPTLKKRWGQHHLRAATPLRPLVGFLEPAGRTVIEIGPGGGVLTGELLATGARVLAWEIDREWAFALGAGEDLALVVGDALDLPWSRLPAGVRVAGNLPYNVATALIDRMLEHTPTLGAAAFLVQWEVGERLTADAGAPAYGASSVLTGARAEVSLLGRVPRGAFRPPPKVDGALVGLRPRWLVPRAEWPVFRACVLQAFAERRKTVRNSLASGWGRGAAEAALAEAGTDPGVRAERLGVSQLAAIARAAARQGTLASDGTIAVVRDTVGRTGS